MNEKIEEIINKINSQTNWTLNQKIRYAYIELGKNIHLNAKFFYSLYQVLDKDTKYSIDELRELYAKVKPSAQVMCRDCAYMLKMIFDKCGINSKIMETCEVDHYKIDNTFFDIQHFFLCVEGDNQKKYFLSLAVDLPYIQMNMQTEHFATNVVYKNGSGEQVYQGPRIHNTVMNKQEIRKLDESLGLIKNVINDKEEYFNETFSMLKDENRDYDMYLTKLALSNRNKFYHGLARLLSDDKDALSINLNDIENYKLERAKRYICKSAKDKLLEENIDIDDTIKYIIGMYLIKGQYKKYLEVLNKVLKANKIENKDGQFGLYALITSSIKLVETIEKLQEKMQDKKVYYNTKEFKELKNKFNSYVKKCCYSYIPKRERPTYDNRITNKYIANKIRLLFPDIFDFGNDTRFTNLELVEKKVIFERVINSLFPELSKDKFVTRKKENPIENRIGLMTIYDKLYKEYKLLILIDATEEENAIPFIYNFNNGKNCFENYDGGVLQMRADKERFIFLSKSFEIRAQENIEGKKRR